MVFLCDFMVTLFLIGIVMNPSDHNTSLKVWVISIVRSNLHGPIGAMVRILWQCGCLSSSGLKTNMRSIMARV